MGPGTFSFIFHFVIDGGAASGVEAQAVFGSAPMASLRVPPAAMSAWLNQQRSSGLPFNVAPVTYVFTGDRPCASIVKVRWPPRSIAALSTWGAPITYTPSAGLTG